MPKQRNHNEWFRPISKTTCECGQRHTEVWSWGEYHRAKWNTIAHFCQSCFVTRVQKRLQAHTGDCGCAVTLVGKYGQLPEWINLGSPVACPVSEGTALTQSLFPA